MWYCVCKRNCKVMLSSSLFLTGKPPPENYIPPEQEGEDALFKTIEIGINFDKYDDIPVELTGNNPSKPIQSFAEAGLMETIEGNVRRAKYFKPTPVQKYAIGPIMAGRDLMGCAQTGSGKTVSSYIINLYFFTIINNVKLLVAAIIVTL